MQQIVDLDEKNQILTTNNWLTLNWHDTYMQWEPAKYGNITVGRHMTGWCDDCGAQDIRVDPALLWTPDLLLYNSANENFDSKYPSHLIVRHNGVVEQIPPGIKQAWHD